MNEKIFEILEFQKIKDRLSDFATSTPGKLMCRGILPASDLEIVQSLQKETSAARERILHNPEISFVNVTDISKVCDGLEAGNSLTPAELIQICKILETVTKVKAYGCRNVPEEKRDVLDSLFNQLQAYRKITEEIRRCILSENQISDVASLGLEKVRRQLKSMQGKIQDRLRTIISGSAKNYLQDSLIVQRDGAYCLSVKYACRSKVSGIMHGQSGTGASVFIEPKSVASLSAEARELMEREKQEILIVLGDLSNLVSEYVKYIRRNVEILTKLDFIFAKAYFSESYQGSEPQFNQKGEIRIIKGRHPLLNPETVVPSTIELGKEYNLLVITGPNTGGKTLTMKTVGLFTIMGQSGLHIPAEAGSELAVFKEVFADIGDEQSIAQSLSTFSSHMTNIIKILKAADKESLVLVDEIGSGTDPAEGAALAIAILSKLHGQGIRTMATTHYSEIKTFALKTQGMQNACCEFDVETLSPTYRLMIGFVGNSNAFAISKKLGLDDEIISEAKKCMESEQHHAWSLPLR